MENASEALKMATTVLVFVVALSITFSMFSELNKVSKVVLSGADETKYYDYIETSEKSRIVGLETIIPTLYKYDKEKYTVLFLASNGTPLELYKTQMNPDNWLGVTRNDVTGNVETYPNVVNKYYKDHNGDGNTETKICAFDLDDETIRTEPWTAKPEDRKRNLDAFLNGETIIYNTSDGEKKYEYKISGESFMDKYSKRQFKETIGEYVYNINSDTNDKLENSLIKNKKKRIVVYQLV